MTDFDPADPALAAAMHAYYEQRAPEYDDWYDRRGRYDNPASNAQWHAEVAQLEAWADGWGGGRVLDLACGTGRWTPRLAAPPGAWVVGADYAPAMLAQTAVRMAAYDRTARLRRVRANAYSLPFVGATFDTVFFGFWLSHVPPARRPAFFAEVRRVTRPGGRICLFDSQQPPDGQAVQIQTRPLNDGSQHAVLKIYYTPETLTAALAPLVHVRQACSTEQFFVVGEVEVPTANP